jgi:hypothetical protein
MIRVQQEQLATIQRQNGEPSPALTEDSSHPTPASTSCTPATNATTEALPPLTASTGGHASRVELQRPRSMSRESSLWPNSRGTSPALMAQSGTLAPLTEDFFLAGTRDDCAFFQAETASLTRENRMLRKRVAELG